MTMRLLYLLGEVPYPITSGGKRAIANHLQLIRDMSDWQVVVVAVDADGDRGHADWPLPRERFAIHCLERSQPRIRGLRGVLSALMATLCSAAPRAVRVRRSAKVEAMVGALLREGGFTAVLFEHIASYGMVPDAMPAGLPLIHISQNVESKVAHDLWRKLSWLKPLKAIMLLEALKTDRCERRLQQRVDGTVCISSEDAATLSAISPGRMLAWTEPYWPHPVHWRGDGEHALLFVGSAKYFPNAEALGWLVTQLMPALRRLDARAHLLIAGTTPGELATICPLGEEGSCTALGFVSDAEKDRLHQVCDLFVCPIVSGSGVKMKALDAMAYSMPLLCTPECLAGVTTGEDTAVIGRLEWGDAGKSAQLVAQLLANRADLDLLARRSAEVLRRRNGHAREFIDFIASTPSRRAPA